MNETTFTIIMRETLGELGCLTIKYPGIGIYAVRGVADVFGTTRNGTAMFLESKTGKRGVEFLQYDFIKRMRECTPLSYIVHDETFKIPKRIKLDEDVYVDVDEKYFILDTELFKLVKEKYNG